MAGTVHADSGEKKREKRRQRDGTSRDRPTPHRENCKRTRKKLEKRKSSIRVEKKNMKIWLF